MIEPRVIFESDDFLVLDKPSGLIAHSDGRTKEPSVAEWLVARYPQLEAVGEPWVSPQGERIPIAGTVHRLDRTTSGVMLVSKTPAAFAELKLLFKERRIEKTYVACVHGHMEKSEGKIVAEIVRSSERPKRWYARPCDESDTRAAITEWKVLRQFEHGHEMFAYIEARPRTGRTHQLRVHFSSIGHPLVGDELYGGRAALGFERPALHASRVALDFMERRLVFAAPLPGDLAAVAQ